MNHPMIIDAPLTVRQELVQLLLALDTGLLSPDGSTDAEKSWAEAKQAIVAEGVAELDAVATDEEAHRAYMATQAKLAQLRRYGAASGRFASVREPVPVYEAVAQSRGMSALPMPAQSGPRITTGQQFQAVAATAALQAETFMTENHADDDAARARVMAGPERGAK